MSATSVLATLATNVATNVTTIDAYSTHYYNWQIGVEIFFIVIFAIALAWAAVSCYYAFYYCGKAHYSRYYKEDMGGWCCSFWIAIVIAAIGGIGWAWTYGERRPFARLHVTGSKYTPTTMLLDSSATSSIGSYNDISRSLGCDDGVKTCYYVETCDCYVDTPGTRNYRLETTIGGYHDDAVVSVEILNGHPAPEFRCEITGSTAFAPTNISCYDTGSYTRYPETHIIDRAYSISGGPWMRVGPNLINYLVKTPGNYYIGYRITDSRKVGGISYVGLDILDGSPIITFVVKYSEEKYKSPPITLTANATDSRTVVPGAEFDYFIFYFPGNDPIKTKNSWAKAFIPEYTINHIIVVGFDTTGHHGDRTQTAGMTQPNPIVDAKVTYQVTGELWIDPRLSQANHPDTTIKKYS